MGGVSPLERRPVQDMTARATGCRMDTRTGRRSESMTVCADKFALRNLSLKPSIGIGHHLRDISSLVGEMVKVKHAGIVFGHKQSAVGTLLTVEFCLKETGATGREVFFLVVNLTVVRGLGCIKVGRIGGVAGFAGVHVCSFSQEMFARMCATTSTLKALPSALYRWVLATPAV